MNKKNLRKRLLALVVTGVMVIPMVGCGNSKEKDESTNNSFNHNTVKLEVMGSEVEYKKVPETIVSLNSHTTENLFALGLGDKIIGTSYNNVEILPEYKEKFDRIPVLAEKYPSMEVLLSKNPEFVYGRNSAFGEKGVGTVRDMVSAGIMPYVAKGTYTPGATIEAVYEDFNNLGKIFNVEDKASEIVNEMMGKISKVQEKTSKIENKKTVFVYDSGEDKAYTAGKSLQTNLIELAGGVNVFGNELEKTWENVNWEAVVDKNPDYIIINDYGDKSAQDKINFLKTHPALKDMKAIKEDKFIVIQLSSMFEGIRNDEAVEFLASEMYPELFK